MLEIEAIKRLKYKYMRCIDRKLWDELREVSSMCVDCHHDLSGAHGVHVDPMRHGGHLGAPTRSSGATDYRLDVSTDNTFAGSFVTGFNDQNVGNVTSTSVTGLTGGTTYYYDVESSDHYGNTVRDDNGGEHYRFTTDARGDLLLVIQREGAADPIIWDVD